jgi:O-antigen/teichoic acid export membrane protein
VNLEKNKESTTKKGLNGILWNFSGSLVQIFLQLLIIGILSRLLSPEEFGVVAVVMILVGFSDLFTDMGISSALIQLPEITEKHISLGYTISIFIGITIGVCFFFFAPYAGTFFEIKDANNAIQFFAIFFPLRSFNSVANALLTRELRFSLLVKFGVVSYLLGIGLTSIILAYLGFGYWSLILGQFIGLLITLGLLIYFKPPSFSLKFEKKIIKELLFFGSGHTLGTLFNYFAENVDNIIVSKSFGTVALGFYSKAFQLLAIPSKFFGGIFDKVLFPILSQKQNKKDKLVEFYLFSTSICFGLLIPISVLILINAELIVSILLGSQWSEVVLPLQILILGMAFRFGAKINKSYLKSLGLIFRGAYYNFIFALLMLLCCFLGGYWYELPGVAGGVFVATILNYFQVGYRLYKNLRFSINSYLLLLGKVIIIHAPFLLITMILIHFQINSKWIHLLLSIFIYIPTMLYLFLNKRNIIFNETNFSMIAQILQAFPNKIHKILSQIQFLKKYYV